MKQNSQDCEEMEIDLREYLSAVVRRRKMIMTIFTLSIIAAFFVSLLRPKIFEAHTIIRLGHISTTSVSKANIIEELRSPKLFDSAFKKIHLNNDKKQLNSIRIRRIEDMEGTDFIKITVTGPDPVLTVDICNTIASDFVATQNEIIRKNIAFLNEQYSEFEKRYQFVLNEINNFNKKIGDAEDNPNYPLLQNTITNYENICFSLKEKVFSLKEQILQSQDFEVFEAAAVPKAIQKTSISRNVLISGIAGLIFAIFLVSFLEHWGKSR